MTNDLSKTRDIAGIEIARIEPEFFGRGNAVEELNAARVEREAKTARLREARLAKDRRDMMAATVAKLAKRAAKV